MGTWILLTAEAAEGSGFGLNLDILETNIINLAILIGVLVYFGRGFLGKTLADRRARIEEAIQDANKRKQDAAAALAVEQQKLSQAQAEAAQILEQAKAQATATREAILAKAQDDIQRLQSAAAQDLSSQQERIIAELKLRVATMALEKVEGQLQAGLDDSTQQRLIDRSIAMMGGA